MVLRRLVRERWDTVAGGERAAVRQALPAALACGAENTPVLTAAATAVAAVADAEGLEAWPELLPGLVGAVVSGVASAPGTRAASLARGAMRCLTLLAEDLRGATLLDVARSLMPQLLAVLPLAPSDAVAEALSCVAEAVAGLIMNETAEQGRAAAKALKVLLPGWLEACTAAISGAAAAVAADAACVSPATTQALQCAKQSLRLVQAALTCFGKYVEAALSGPLRATWGLLLGAREAHSKAAAEVEIDAESPLGEAMGQLLELLVCVVEHPRFAPSLEANSTLAELCAAALCYMQMTAAQVEEWAADANQYVADEDIFACSVRDGATMLFEECVEVYDVGGLKAAGGAVWQALDAASAARSAKRADWWRPAEAALFAAGRIAHLVDGSLNSDEGTMEAAGAMQLPRLIELGRALLAEGDASGDGASGFLRGRALWLCAKYAGSLPERTADEVATHAARALGDNAAPVPLRVCACRAVAALARECRNSRGGDDQPLALTQHLPSVYAGACAMATQVDEDMLHLVLELFESVIALDAGAASAAAEHVAPLALSVWQANFNDPLIGEDASDVLKALVATSAAAAAAVLSRAVPGVASLVSASAADATASGSAETGLMEAALHLLASIVERAPPAAARAAYEALAPRLLPHCISPAADAGVAQAACCALRAFAHASSSGAELTLWCGGNAPRHLIECVTTLMRVPGAAGCMTDRAMLFTGGFARTLLGRLRGSPGFESLAVACCVGAASRLCCVETMPLLKPALALVLARCVQLWSAEAVCNAIGAERVGLTLEQWCEAHAEVQGAYEIRLSLSALLAIMGAPSLQGTLQATSVRGEKIANAREGVRTRRQAAREAPTQYTVVPLGAKILTVIGAAVLEAQEAYAAPKGFREADFGNLGEDDYDAIGGGDDDYDFGLEEGGDDGPSPFLSAEEAFGGDLVSLLGAQLEEGDAEGGETDLDAAAEPELARLEIERSARESLRALAASSACSATLQALAPAVGKAQGEALSKLMADA